MTDPARASAAEAGGEASLEAPLEAPLEAWSRAAFRADYLERHAHRDLAEARRHAAFLVERGLSGRVVDLACGQGRHALALLERGVETVGVDASRELLERAGELEGGERLAGRLVRGDLLRLPFARASFDGAVQVQACVGYLGEAGDARALREARRVLRPGGLLVLDLLNPARVRRTLVPEAAHDAGDLRVRERRWLMDGGRRAAKQVEVARDGTALRAWREEVRLYERDEVVELLEDAGLEAEAFLGDFRGGELRVRSERMVVVARG